MEGAGKRIITNEIPIIHEGRSTRNPRRVDSTLSKQIKFRESHPELNEIFPVMPKPGRSIPNFCIENISASVPHTTTNFQALPYNMNFHVKPTNGPSKGGKNKLMAETDMISSFDEAVLNPNIHRAQIKSTIMKKQLQRDLENRLKHKTKDNAFREEMEKMKDQLLGDITSEISFNNNLQGQLPLEKVESYDAIGNKIDNIMKEWATDSIKVGNKDKLRKSESTQSSKDNLSISPKADVRRISLQSMKKDLVTGKLPSGRRLTSTDKLSEISQSFRQSLQPFATRDPRELIKTPDEDILAKLSEKHSRAVRQKKYDEDIKNLARRTTVNDSSSGQNERSNSVQPLKIGSGFLETVNRGSNARPLKGKATQSLNVSRTTSKELSGLMDFRSLLEIQSGKVKRKPEIEHLQYNEKSLGIGIGQQESNAALISGSQVHSKLTDSVKIIDKAAKIAQSLGTLMSKVAIQNSNSGNNTIPQPVEQDSDKKLNRKKPGLPISEDFHHRASYLKNISEQAKKAIQFHTMSSGASPPSSPGRAKKTESVTEIQTDKVHIDKTLQDPSDDFEFVTDMSFSEQLILKKLRAQKSQPQKPV